MNVLVKFSRGLGDAIQLTCVLQHLAKYRPDWTVDVASQIGKHSAFFGQCRRSWILDREPIPEYEYRHVFDLGWYECYSVYADSPCTKVCNCLREEFGIVPDLLLLKYEIQVGDPTPHRLLNQIRPDVLVKGGTTAEIVGQEVVEAYGGRVCRIGQAREVSTTRIVTQIQHGFQRSEPSPASQIVVDDRLEVSVHRPKS